MDAEDLIDDFVDSLTTLRLGLASVVFAGLGAIMAYAASVSNLADPGGFIVAYAVVLFPPLAVLLALVTIGVGLAEGLRRRQTVFGLFLAAIGTGGHLVCWHLFSGAYGHH